tara:strand:+ start:315 stop:644 length:330 start_codon:yes stop_codon:yes gene_type:complete
MKTKINTTKTEYIRIDGWRGYSQPVNAIGGCNDTGMWEDSPCKSDVAEKEIKQFQKILRNNKIKYRTTNGTSSNVFCGKIYVCVNKKDRQEASLLARAHQENTTLFYEC